MDDNVKRGHQQRLRAGGMKAFLATIVLIGLVACGGGGGTSTNTSGLGSRATAISFFTSNGFTGSESPLSDGTPRWLGNGPNRSVGEVQGPRDTTTKVSLIVAASSETGTLSGTFLGHFAPGSSEFLSEVIDATRSSGSQDQSRVISGRTVRIQTIDAGDGSYLVTMTVT